MRAQAIMRGIFDSLLAQYPITYNDSVLMLPESEADPNAWVAWTEGIDTIRYEKFSRELEGLRASQSLSLSPSLPQRHYILLALVNARHILRMVSIHSSLTPAPPVTLIIPRSIKEF